MNATLWTEPDVETSTLKRLILRAAEASAEHRAAIPHLYDAGANVGGETRYQLLWCLCQLESTCRALAKFAEYSAETEHTEREELADNIAAQIERAQSLKVEIEQIIRGATNVPSPRSTTARSSARARRIRATDVPIQPPVAV